MNKEVDVIWSWIAHEGMIWISEWKYQTKHYKIKQIKLWKSHRKIHDVLEKREIDSKRERDDFWWFDNENITLKMKT